MGAPGIGAAAERPMEPIVPAGREVPRRNTKQTARSPCHKRGRKLEIPSHAKQSVTRGINTVLAPDRRIMRKWLS